jgi:glutaminase
MAGVRYGSVWPAVGDERASFLGAPPIAHVTMTATIHHGPGQEPAGPWTHVSTGALPPAEDVQAHLAAAWARYAPVTDGHNSTVYPALSARDPALFGLAVADCEGSIHSAGDAHHPFTIMSVSKPFVFALVAQAIGPDRARALVGANATGLPFDSIEAIERSPDGRTNPMVNAGAILATSLVPGKTEAERWQVIHEGLSAFAGRALESDAEVLQSARATNFRNRGIANTLSGIGLLQMEADAAVDLYTRQCALSVSAVDLAVMGATLASGGTNPLTGKQVVSPDVCRLTLAMMATAGLYETSGDWLCQVGLPGKSGIGGGILVVSPGKGGAGTFSPPLDAAGNSVRGQLAARYLSCRLGLDLFVARPSRMPDSPADASPVGQPAQPSKGLR